MEPEYKALSEEGPAVPDFLTEPDGGQDDLPEERGYRTPRGRGRKKTLIVILISAASVLLLALIVFAAIRLTGKPVYDNTGEFYFSSDLLSVDGGSYTVYNEINFRVNNFADKLRVSDSDVESYSVKVTASGEDVTDLCAVAKESASLPGGTVSSSLVTVTLPDGLYGVPLEVEAASSPTEIVLHGTFTVVPSWGSSLSDSPGSVYCALTVWTNEDASVKITWDDTLLIPDKSDPFIRSGAEGNACTFALAAGTGAEIRFFKNDISADYSASSDPVVTVSRTAAAPSAQDGRSAYDTSDDTASDDGNPEK